LNKKTLNKIFKKVKKR